MRVLFLGTGEISLPSFLKVTEECTVVGLVTQPDRPVGRSSKPRPPRIKELALEHDIPVLQPERMRNTDALAEVAELRPDLVIVMAYGQILPAAFLELPTMACINVHASLLPRHRGASCIQAALDAGDAESGVTIMHVAEGLDTGDLILKKAVTLDPKETGGELHDRLAELSPSVLMEAVALLQAGSAPRIPQTEKEATYAPKLNRADGALDWQNSAIELERRIRAYDPWPGTYAQLELPSGKAARLKIFPVVEAVEGRGRPGEILGASGDLLTIACGEGALKLGALQLEGSRRMPVHEFLVGHKLSPGQRLFSLESAQE